MVQTQTKPVLNVPTAPAVKAPAVQPAVQAMPQTESKSVFKKWWFWLIIILVIAGIGAGIYFLLS